MNNYDIFYKIKKYECKNSMQPKNIYIYKINMYKKLLGQRGGYVCGLCVERKDGNSLFEYSCCGYIICANCQKQLRKQICPQCRKSDYTLKLI